MADEKTDASTDPLADFSGALRYLAEHTDLSPNQARQLVRRFGSDRKALLEAARTMKAEG